VANFPPVSTAPAVSVAKFAASVVDTGGAPWLGEYLHDFSKKFEMTLMLFLGARGKMIHEKISEAKNLVTRSLYCFAFYNSTVADQTGRESWTKFNDHINDMGEFSA
jgi:hypothetical protein